MSIDYTSQYKTFSRWASEEEIKSSLYKIDLDDYEPPYGGIPLFTDSGAVYIEQDDSHSLVIGSTGSKKTRLVGMPALRLYARAGESFIATDPKAELYERTLPLLREQGYHVFVLNLRDPRQSNCWNPFIIPYHQYNGDQREQAIAGVTDMANCMVKDDYNHDPYWQNSAADMLSGLILTLFECAQENEIHLKSLRTLRTQAFKNDEHTDKPFISQKFLKHLNPGSFVYSLLCGTAEVTDSTRSCIISVFDQALRPFFSQDKLIDMLSCNDLDMSTIGKRKTAIFLIIPDENTLYHRLVSVFVKQCYTALILEAQKQAEKKLPRRVNFLLDEFSTLPPINDFPAMITASRSRNIRFNLIIQSIKQLQNRYGIEAETIRGNCENLVFLHSRELPLLNDIISLAGNKNNEEPLVSVSMLQTLDKTKGEAFVMHKRLHPFIAKLLDIDGYFGVSPDKKPVHYPNNTRKAQVIFDFNIFCNEYDDDYYSLLFTGTKPLNPKKKKWINDDDIMEPIFTSRV